MDPNTSMSMSILFNFDCFQGLHRTKLGIGKSPVETRIVMTGCWFDSKSFYINREAKDYVIYRNLSSNLGGNHKEKIGSIIRDEKK